MNREIKIDRAKLDDLERLHEFIDEFAHAAGLDESIVFTLRLSIEEAFVNLIQHGYRNKPGRIVITLRSNAQQVSVDIQDFAPPFPPERAPKPLLGSDLTSRPVGGLGWHFIREMMDEIRYTSDPKAGNILTLIKRLA